MKQAQKRSLIILLGILLILGSGIIAFNYIVPEIGNARMLRGELNELRLILEEEKETVKLIESYLDKYLNQPETKEILSLSLPLKEDIPSIVNQISGISRLSGVAVDSINLSNRTRDPVLSDTLVRPIGKINISLSGKATYESLKRYIGDIERNIRIMDIESVSISEQTTEENQIINYSLSINTYYQR